MSKPYPALLCVIALVLTLTLLSGCSSDTADAPGTKPSNNTGNGTAVTPQPEPANPPGGNTSGNGTAPAPTHPTDTDTGSKPEPAPEDGKPAVVAGNDAFRVYGPAPGSVIGKSFTVRGQARVFEAAFSYNLEDGHNILAEGHPKASIGAPEWGDFEFTVKLSEMPTSPTGVLTIYEASAKDGSPLHELHIPYTFDKAILKLETK
ncbi:Gmad2 immunoglobulin-like domain-containing protein [Paenibacillus sp. R14(2021)]|uniref:Gmad2 immunoglobulin-like domain-containing protein n=1 Tax=Paenibacillus sp. R14(2021) TaxID=2859228 RepID=UPI001C6134AD|nr:Gmad2 immunoglobulin-like domain-containing protein [Paenibacillus sp. R14(2021)]